MKGKVFALLSLVVALILVLNACSEDSTSSDASKSGEKVTINMMHLWPEGTNSEQNKLVSQIIEDYKAENKNVKFKIEVLENEQYKARLKVLASGNNLPDVGFTWAAGFLEPYAMGNLFAPLDDLLAGDLKNSFVGGTTEAYAVYGKTYALPVELNIVPVYYNKEIFAAYNLKPPRTYDDLKNIITTLKENNETPITLGGKDGWTGSFWYMYLADRLGGPELMDQSVKAKTFTDPQLIEAAKMAQDLVDMGAFVKGFNGLSNDEAKSEFMNEKAAMYAMGTWEVPNFTTSAYTTQAFKDKIGFFKFPTISGGKGATDTWVGGPGVGLFVSEKSPVKEEAKKFVNYFVKKWGEKSVTNAGIIPATKVDTASIKLPQMFIDLLNELNNAKKVTLYLDVQMKPVASNEHYKLIQALLGKQVTPLEFGRKTEDTLKAGK